MKRLSGVVLGLVVAFLAAAPRVEAGKIVVNNDEWTLSDTGFTTSAVNDPGTFATNVASWFSGGGPGSFLAYSNNFGLAQPQLATAMTGAGHSWTVNPLAIWTLPNLQTYDGVFLAANAVPDVGVLIAYVNGGGNVYLAGGTACCGGAAGEALQWNAFLNVFGLSYAPAYNGVGGNIPISSGHPIFANVDHLYQNNGNSVSDLDPADPRNVVLVSQGGQGLYAVYDSSVPEPGTMLLLGMGLGALGVRRRFRR